MIIYIESFYGDAVISGKVRTVGQLKYRVFKTLKEVGQKDFVSVFCARYNFDIIPIKKDVIGSLGEFIKNFIPVSSVRYEINKSLQNQLSNASDEAIYSDNGSIPVYKANYNLGGFPFDERIKKDYVIDLDINKIAKICYDEDSSQEKNL
ncbi:MAG: hypothetical protein FWC47_17535 [Oscillospiraceae bacterium]|nr:hypothetical protein [Oscillospiraceae bacterium]